MAGKTRSGSARLLECLRVEDKVAGPGAITSDYCTSRVSESNEPVDVANEPVEWEGAARLLRPQRDLNRVRWPGGGVEFHPGHGEWIRILRANGFVVEALHELYAAVSAENPDYYCISSAQWAAQWPIEDLWVARL